MFANKADSFAFCGTKVPNATNQSSEPGLMNKKLADVLLLKTDENRKLQYITPDATVLDALNFMRENNFTAAPIIDSAKRGRSRIVGVLNLFDLVIAISHSAELDSIDKSSSDINENLPIFQLPASAILGSSAESSYNWVFNSDQSLSELLHTFATGVHRVIVIDDAGLVSKSDITDLNIETHSYVLTQMDLLRYVVKNPDLLSESAYRSLFDLHLAPRTASFDHFHSYSSSGIRKHIDDLAGAPAPAEINASRAAEAPSKTSAGIRRASVTDSLRFCLDTNSALSAFRAMHRDRRGDVTALAVVEQATFKLIGTISTSDFRFLTSSTLSALGLPVTDFLQRINSELEPSKSMRASYLFQVTNKGSDSLVDAIKQMVENCVHRTWLCDDIDRPVAVVSCSDAISKLGSFDEISSAEDDEAREEF